MMPMKALLALGFLIFVGHCAAQASGSGSLQTRLDGIFEPWTRGSVPGCAAGVMESGRWLARGGYGSAEIESGARLTTDTVFYAASVSKQFTAAALLHLVDQGRVSLEDDIRTHIPELPEYVPRITVRNLIHHTSGLPDFVTLLARAGTLHEFHTAAEIVAMLSARKPRYPAGLLFSYSNSNYFLLAEIVRHASGSTLRAYAKRALFEPLGMGDTRFNDDPSEVVPRYARGYVEEGLHNFRAVKTSYSQVGAGGLLTQYC